MLTPSAVQLVGPLVLSGGTDHHVMVFDTRKDTEPILDFDTGGTVHRFNCLGDKLFVGTGDCVTLYNLYVAREAQGASLMPCEQGHWRSCQVVR